MLRRDDDAVYVIEWAPVPSLRRTKHKIPHGFHEYTTVARIPDRGTHLNPCHTPVGPNPEPDLVLPLFFGRRARGDIWYQERRGPEDITRAPTRARTRIRAGPGPAARPGAPARPRSLSRPTRRSIARPHNRSGRGHHDEGGGGPVDLHPCRDWGNRRHGDGRRLRSGHRFSVRRRRRRKREPTDRGTTAAPTATARARTTPTPALEQRSATPEHEQSDRDVHGERQGGRRPFPPLRERERVAVEDWSRSGRHDL